MKRSLRMLLSARAQTRRGPRWGAASSTCSRRVSRQSIAGGAALVLGLGSIALGRAGAASASWRTVQYHPFEQVAISCAAALLCEIELQPGEHVRDGLGSLVQLWDNHLVYEGTSPETPHLVVKPERPGLSENVLLTTNRRTYRLFLTSTSSSDPTYLRFDYDDEERARDRHLARMREHDRAQQIAARPTPTATPIVTLDQACASMTQPVFRADPTPAQFHPRAICDTSDHTFIALPLTATQPTDLPIPLAVTAEGDRPVNYRYDADSRVFVVDGAGADYVLVAMDGRRSVRVRIQRIETPEGRK